MFSHKTCMIEMGNKMVHSDCSHTAAGWSHGNKKVEMMIKILALGSQHILASCHLKNTVIIHFVRLKAAEIHLNKLWHHHHYDKNLSSVITYMFVSYSPNQKSVVKLTPVGILEKQTASAEMVQQQIAHESNICDLSKLCQKAEPIIGGSTQNPDQKHQQPERTPLSPPSLLGFSSASTFHPLPWAAVPCCSWCCEFYINKVLHNCCTTAVWITGGFKSTCTFSFKSSFKNYLIYIVIIIYDAFVCMYVFMVMCLFHLYWFMVQCV